MDTQTKNDVRERRLGGQADLAQLRLFVFSSPVHFMRAQWFVVGADDETHSANPANSPVLSTIFESEVVVRSAVQDDNSRPVHAALELEGFAPLPVEELLQLLLIDDQHPNAGPVLWNIPVGRNDEPGLDLAVRASVVLRDVVEQLLKNATVLAGEGNHRLAPGGSLADALQLPLHRRVGEEEVLHRCASWDLTDQQYAVIRHPDQLVLDLVLVDLADELLVMPLQRSSGEEHVNDLRQEHREEFDRDDHEDRFSRSER